MEQKVERELWADRFETVKLALAEL